MKKIRTLLILLAFVGLSISSAFAQGGTTGTLTWNLNNGTLTISGTGAMPDYEFAPWSPYINNITAAVIGNGVTTIGNYAFFGCTALASITLPSSVQTIGDYAFSYCFALESITLPSSVTTIGDYAFSYCTALASITLPNSVTTIGEYAFIDCTALASVTLPSSVQTIGSAAFHSCSALESITLPSSITTIENYAFSKCTSLASITLPNSVTTIGNGAFFGCTALASITLPSSVQTIGDNAFHYCPALASITLPSSVQTIGDNAFHYCPALASITLPNSVTTIGNYAFRECTALTSVTNLNPEPVYIESNVFFGVNIGACTLQVPASSVSDYQNAAVWQEFNPIVGVYSVSVSANNDDYGTVTGSGYYELNETATLIASALSDCKFVNWTKNGIEISKDNPYTLTVTEDIELLANFEEKLGIEKFELSNFKIYPNPTRGVIYVTRDSRDNLRITDIEVFDMYGRAVETWRAASLQNTATLDISHLPTGIYFLRMGNETVKVVKE